VSGSVIFNRDLLGWVLENLIKNGIDALADGKGTIAVRMEDRADGWITVVVTDTGKGIPGGVGNRIFDPGFTTKPRGWGMGLALVKRIVVQYHRGRIRIVDTGPAGTSIAVSLPPVGS
jgi:signal transduction histidine kinase